MSGPGGNGMALEAGRLVGDVLRKEWTTPRRLIAFRTWAWVLTGLLLFVGESTLNRARVALRTVAKDTAPSILAAEEIGAALARLDASVANGLLGNATQRVVADALVEKQRVVATNGILRAAENITYGDAERIPITAMITDLGRYLEQQAQARLLFDRADVPAAKAAYASATDLLHRRLLVSADQLDAANKEQMDVTYANQKLEEGESELAAAVCGALLAGALVWTQWFMFRRMRRIVNVPLAAATLLTVLMTGYLVRCFTDTREDLRVAKLDAFDSIYALVRGRTVAYDANGDQSRYLLDMDRASSEREFRRKVNILTADPAMASATKVQLSSANPATRGAASRQKPKVQGLLWDEVRNITFDGEYAAASDALTTFAGYYAIDAKLRLLKQSGKDSDAIELAIGTGPDESKAAFDRFDRALQRTVDVNQAAFDDATGRAEAELKRAEILDPGFALLIAVCIWLGVRQRLSEYRA